MTRTSFVLLLVIAFGLSFEATAGMRCANGKLANKNDKMGDVSQKCGAPASKRKFGRVTINDRRVNLERWTYIPEKGKFIKYLDFHNGILREISNGARVK